MKIRKFEIKIFDLGIFAHEFENTIVITEISTVKFVKNAFSTHTINASIGSDFSNGQG